MRLAIRNATPVFHKQSQDIYLLAGFILKEKDIGIKSSQASVMHFKRS